MGISKELFWEWVLNRPKNDDEAREKANEVIRILSRSPIEEKEYKKGDVVKLVLVEDK